MSCSNDNFSLRFGVKWPKVPRQRRCLSRHHTQVRRMMTRTFFCTPRTLLLQTENVTNITLVVVVIFMSTNRAVATSEHQLIDLHDTIYGKQPRFTLARAILHFLMILMMIVIVASNIMSNKIVQSVRTAIYCPIFMKWGKIVIRNVVNEIMIMPLLKKNHIWIQVIKMCLISNLANRSSVANITCQGSKARRGNIIHTQ